MLGYRNSLFWILTFNQIMIFGYYFLFHMLPLHSVAHALWYIEILTFDPVRFLCLYFWCHVQGVIFKSSVMRLFSFTFLKNFIVSAFVFRPLIHFELMIVHGTRCLVSGHSVFPATFVGKTFLSPGSGHGTVAGNHLTLCVRVCFWLCITFHLSTCV